jgi:hypothetical protein
VLVIETNVTPPIVYDPAAPESAGGAWLLRLIQPTIRGALPLVGTFEQAPWGAAVPGLGTAVFFGVLGLALFGAYRLVKGR